MIIQHNLTAMNTNRSLGTVSKRLSKKTEKLSSGYKINRSADDAAGLSISEKMRSQIRGLNKASKNAQDGISFIQVAEGALGEVHNVLQRGRELAVQAANDTNTPEDRAAIKAELDSILKEVDRISRDTEFNTIKVFDSSNIGDASEVNPKNSIVTLDGDVMPVKLNVLSTEWDSLAASVDGVDVAGLKAYSESLRDNYIPKILGNIQNTLFSGISPDASGLEIGLKYYDRNDGTLAYVSSNGVGYELGINLKYLENNPSSPGNVLVDSDLMTTIAHEMTHALMFDSVTNGMLGSAGGDKFPGWFVEGVAQTVGGAMNYLAGMPDPTANPDGFKNWMKTFNNGGYNSYAQGYLASAYLGQVASGQSAVSAANIASGLNKLLKDVASGYSLGQAISRATGGSVSDLSAFERSLTKDGMVDFSKEFFAATGSGTGSIASPSGLSGSKDSLTSGGGSGNYFTLVVDGDSFINNNYGSVNPYGGGGATTTSGKDKNGNSPGDVELKWGGKLAGSTAEASDILLLQVGALKGQTMELYKYSLSANELGIDSIDVSDNEKAGNAIDSFDTAIEKVSDMRSSYGALQNRLEHTMANLDTTSENTQAAESRIRDADMAQEMMEYAKDNILLQASQSMLAQANQSTQGVLSLLQ